MSSKQTETEEEPTRRTILRRSALAATTVALGSSIAGTAAAEQSDCDVLVDASGGGDETTIQAGVDAANPGDVVCVADGTYTEQVAINKDLTVQNAPGSTPTIVAPAAASQVSYTIPESGSTWYPVVFAFGGSESGGVISGSGTVDVTVSGFTIDGDAQIPDGRAVGVLYRNVAGTWDQPAVRKNTVQNMGVGGRETFGILVYGDSDVRIEDNDVSEYERGGIAANGDGVNPAPKADIRNNTVTGSTDIGVALAPNGIQIGFGAEGTIFDNEVRDNRWSGSGWVASGIIVFESDGVHVRGNSVENSDAAITCGSWSWFRQSADNNRFVDNEVTDASVGVLLQAVAWDGYSSSDPSVSNTKVTKNAITDDEGTGDPEGAVGVALDATDSDPNFDPVLKNNKVVNNDIEGFDTAIDDEGKMTKVHANEP